MSFSLVYLAQRFFYRIWMFIYNWYVGGLRVIGGGVINILESFDRTWAFRITLRNIFKPLYQDQSIVGRVLGFFFRFWRLLIAGVLYTVIIIFGVSVYAAWAAIPITIVVKGFLS